VNGWEWARAGLVSEFGQGWSTSKLGTCLGLMSLGKVGITIMWPCIRTPYHHPWIDSWIAWFSYAKDVQKEDHLQALLPPRPRIRRLVHPVLPLFFRPDAASTTLASSFPSS
jgi:hypothetical protein